MRRRFPSSGSSGSDDDQNIPKELTTSTFSTTSAFPSLPIAGYSISDLSVNRIRLSGFSNVQRREKSQFFETFILKQEVVYTCKREGADFQRIKLEDFSVNHISKAAYLELDSVYAVGDVFSTVKENENTSEALLKQYQEIQTSFGIPVSIDGVVREDAALRNGTRSISFTCKEMPLDFLKNTIEKWEAKRTSHRELQNIKIIWWKATENRLSKVNKKQIKMQHIWNIDNHEQSFFYRADIDTYRASCGGKNLVDIFLAASFDDERSMVMCIFDQGLIADFGCGGKQGKIALMKKAFAYATKIKDTFFEINVSSM